MSQLKKIRKQGFTSIELLLVIGIMSAISGAIYFIYGNASDKRIAASEFINIQVLVKKLVNATTASNYSNVSNQTLNDYGIYYQSEFQDFKIQGLSNTSFKVNYSQVPSRQCNDFLLKITTMKGEYVITQKINGKNIVSNMTNIVDGCNNNTNDVEIIFSGLSVQNIASVAPGTPKPLPVYAGEGTLNPAYPDRGDVPTNLDSSGKNVNNPGKPIPGTYTPPTYVVAGNPTPGGGATNPGSFIRPTYPTNNPLGPLYNPPDSGNEWVPAVPSIPPRPPATEPPILSREIIVITTGRPHNFTVTLENGVINFSNYWGCITNGGGVNYNIIPLGYNFHPNSDKPSNSPIIKLYPNDYDYWNITPSDGYNLPLDTFTWTLKGKPANEPGKFSRKMTVNEFNNLYSYRIACDYDSN